MKKPEKPISHLELVTLMHYMKHLVGTHTTITDETALIWQAWQMMYLLTDIKISPFNYKNAISNVKNKELVHGYFNMPNTKFNVTHIAHMLGTTQSNVSHHLATPLKKPFHSRAIQHILLQHEDRIKDRL